MVTIENNSIKELQESDKLVVLDFYASWCNPCKALGKAMDELEKEYAGSVVFAKCNAESNEALVEEFGVRNVPTVVLMKDGETVNKFGGAIPKTKLKSAIDSVLN